MGYLRQLMRWLAANLFLAAIRRAYPVSCIRMFPDVFVAAARRPEFRLTR